MRGFVVKLATKEGKQKRPPYRPWTKYSFVTEDTNGNESGWITYGFEAPPFKEGEFIEFEVEEKDGFKDYRKGSGKIIANPPPRASAKAASNPAGAGNSGGGDPPAGAADRQTQIVLQHSQEMAIAAVSVLLDNDALPISKADNKTGQAKRFDEIVSSIDKLTVKFHNDVATGRLLSVVADMGVIDTKPDAQLPEPGKQPSSTESKEY